MVEEQERSRRRVKALVCLNLDPEDAGSTVPQELSPLHLHTVVRTLLMTVLRNGNGLSVRLLALTLWCRLSVTQPSDWTNLACRKSHLHTLRASILPDVHEMQQDGAPARHRRDITRCLDRTLPDQWTGRGGSVECPPLQCLRIC
jgi:hypothetical protein